MKKRTVLSQLIAAGVLFSGSLLAQSSSVAAAPSLPMNVAVATGSATEAQPSEAAAKPAEKPAPKAEAKAPAKPQARFEFTYDERVRSESWNNITDFNDRADDERGNERFRSRFAVNTAVTDNVDFNFRLVNEFRNYRTPTVAFDYDEIFFDSFYLNFKKTPIKGLALKVGRQEIVKGEGLLFSDPTGPDGSRSSYYNAAIFTYSLPKRKATLDVIGILNPRAERFLPTIGTAQPVTWLTVNPAVGASYKEERRQLNEYSAQAVGLYYTDKNNKNVDFETYYFLMKQYDDARAVSAANFIPDRSFHTVGGRVVGRPRKGWTVASELVGEFGKQHAAGAKNAQDMRGWAAYFWGQKAFEAKGKPYVKLGYYALSGDNPATKGTNEGFDPMFTRTIKFNELPFYAGSKERGLGYWQDMYMPQVEVGATPFKQLGLKGTYQFMRAFRPYGGASSLFGKGVNRGGDWMLRAEYTPNKYVKSHFIYERMDPGDFYSVKSQGWFLRAEIMYTYKYSFLTLHPKK